MSSASNGTQPKRPLACVQCKNRKIKCDRKFPCSNCLKQSTNCVPITAPRERRRRFAERELLERLRHYEGLLRQNDIRFEPLHAQVSPQKALASKAASDGGPQAELTEPVDFWDAINQRVDESDEDDSDEDTPADGPFAEAKDNIRAEAVRTALDKLFKHNDDILLFGSRRTLTDLSNLHPPFQQIFKLWQIYLDNVDPLLKVTHTPTLQTRIIDAASNFAAAEPVLQALMFSIYCAALLSIEDNDCLTTFGATKEQLLLSYRFGCQQALLNSGVLCTSNRECLTAFYLYMLSTRPDADPRSLSTMLGAVIRIAQRLGINDEVSIAKCSALEAELRRRLWWAIIIFDNRICEMSGYKGATLSPAWDCKAPLNINDYDLRPDIKVTPPAHERPTELLYVAVRSELANYLRYRASGVDQINPSLKSPEHGTGKDIHPDEHDLNAFAKALESKYFRHCSPDNPLHFMTVWSVRGHISKTRLMEHYARFARNPSQQTEGQRTAALAHAMGVLDADVKVMTSPLLKGYHWLSNIHFPFPAFIHIVQHIRKRPLEPQAERCWTLMSECWAARFMAYKMDGNSLFKMFTKNTMMAWEAFESARQKDGTGVEMPLIVSDMKAKLAAVEEAEKFTPADSMSFDLDDFDFGIKTPAPPLEPPQPVTGFGFDVDLPDFGLGGGFGDTGQAPADFGTGQFDWTHTSPGQGMQPHMQ